MNDSSTDVGVTQAPMVQIFQVAEPKPPHEIPEWEQHQKERLVLEAFRLGYGLIEQPQRSEFKESTYSFFGEDWTEVRFRAMGVKLHA